MGKWLFLHIILIWIVPTQDLETLRLAYKNAGQDDSKIEAFENLVKDITTEDNPVLVGYKGASLTLKAKLEKTIKDKKDLFVQGKGIIEYAIQKDPESVELRFIRLGIQENTPKLLKYKDNIEEDKNFILKNYNTISSKDLKRHISDYIKQSKVFSDIEKQTLNL